MYKRPNEKLAWIDTIGLDDAYFDDDDTFKDILRFIDDNYMTKVKAIIWTVHPNVRCDGLLTNQAKLIEKFAPKIVWNNVIIIVKQSMSPEEDGRGALTAALEYNSKANVQLLGYRFMNDETFTSKQRAKMQEGVFFSLFSLLIFIITSMRLHGGWVGRGSTLKNRRPYPPF